MIIKTGKRKQRRFNLCLSIAELSTLSVVTIENIKLYENNKGLKRFEEQKIKIQLDLLEQAQDNHTNTMPPQLENNTYIRAYQAIKQFDITINHINQYIRENTLKHKIIDIVKVRRIKTVNRTTTKQFTVYKLTDLINIQHKRQHINKALKFNSNNYMVNLFNKHKLTKEYLKEYNKAPSYKISA